MALGNLRYRLEHDLRNIRLVEIQPLHFLSAELLARHGIRHMRRRIPIVQKRILLDLERFKLSPTVGLHGQCILECARDHIEPLVLVFIVFLHDVGRDIQVGKMPHDFLGLVVRPFTLEDNGDRLLHRNLLDLLLATAKNKHDCEQNQNESLH